MTYAADRDPIAGIVAAIRRERPDLAAEYVTESPGWAQAFILRRGHPMGSAVVVTNDGADWCLTRWPTADTFYADDAEPAEQELYADDMSSTLAARRAAAMLTRTPPAPPDARTCTACGKPLDDAHDATD